MALSTAMRSIRLAFLIAFAWIVALPATARAQATCEDIFRSDAFVDNDRARIDELVKVAEQKRELVAEVVRITGLEIPPGGQNGLIFGYLYGRGANGKPLDVSTQVMIRGLVDLSPAELRQAIDDSYGDTSMSPLGLMKNGDFGFEIQGTNYHHSWLGGNHNTKYAKFDMKVSDITRVKSMKTSDDRLDAVIETAQWGVRFYSRLVIDRSRKPYRLSVTQWKSSNPLWAKHKTVYLDDFKWQPKAREDKQTYGI